MNLKKTLLRITSVLFTCTVAGVHFCCAQSISMVGENNDNYNGPGPWNVTNSDGLRIGTTDYGRMFISGGARVHNL